MCFYATIIERPPIVIGEAEPKDLMHPGFRVGTLLREILRLWLRMTSRGRVCWGGGLLFIIRQGAVEQFKYL